MNHRVIFTSGHPGSWGLQFVAEGMAGAVDLDISIKVADDGTATLRADHVGIHGFRPSNDCAARRDDCNILPDGRCWFDGGYSAADDLLRMLVTDGKDALWSELDEWYTAHLTEAVTA